MCRKMTVAVEDGGFVPSGREGVSSSRRRIVNTKVEGCHEMRLWMLTSL
jgi:hypothetical protein